MKKNLIIIGVLVAVLIVGLAIFFSSRSEAPSPQNQKAEQVTELAEYTTEEVAVHNKFDDCWTYINNSVYDITDYVPMHPGGDEILRTCGVDGTNLFEARRTDTGEVVGSGTSHSSAAERQLASYKIGVLKQ